jgi:hypothetical protein
VNDNPSDDTIDNFDSVASKLPSTANVSGSSPEAPPTLQVNPHLSGTTYPDVPSALALYSTPRFEADELGWTDELIEGYREGLHQPLAVHLPPLPDDAPPMVRKVYEDFGWILGLRLAAGRDDAVPYACRWVAKRINACHTAVNGACHYLERAGVIERVHDPKFKNIGGGRPTNMYLPVGFNPFNRKGVSQASRNAPELKSTGKPRSEPC